MTREPLDREALVADAWARVEVVDETTSTNADLLADVDAPDRSVLVAEHQTSGRGRLDRGWQSPAGAGLTFSMLVRPRPPMPTWGWLPLLVGVALNDAVATSTGADVGLKWPNDLLHRPSGRKLAGILAQSTDTAVVLGIGLNVSTTGAELPVPTATSLTLCSVPDPDRADVLVTVLARVAERLDAWTESAGDAEACGLAAAYREACLTLGRDVRVSTTIGNPLVGRAVGVDRYGRLQVEVAGTEHAVGAGDVEHVR